MNLSQGSHSTLLRMIFIRLIHRSHLPIPRATTSTLPRSGLAPLPDPPLVLLVHHGYLPSFRANTSTLPRSDVAALPDPPLLLLVHHDHFPSFRATTSTLPGSDLAPLPSQIRHSPDEPRHERVRRQRNPHQNHHRWLGLASSSNHPNASRVRPCAATLSKLATARSGSGLNDFTASVNPTKIGTNGLDLLPRTTTSALPRSDPAPPPSPHPPLSKRNPVRTRPPPPRVLPKSP